MFSKELVIQKHESETYLVLPNKCSPLIQTKSDDESRYYMGCEYLCEHDEIVSYDDVKNYTAIEFITNVCVCVTPTEKEYPHLNWVSIGKAEERISIRVTLSFDTADWDADISILKFIKIFSAELNSWDFSEFDAPQDVEDGFYNISFIFDVLDEQTICSAMSDICKRLGELHQSIIDGLFVLNGTVIRFKFPSELRHAYAQYLLYFGRFLEDLGIDSMVSVEMGGEGVLIKIVPKGSTVKVEEIRAALVTYLSLPIQQDSRLVHPRGGDEGDLRYRQLMSVVNSLEEQVKISEHLIGIKDKNIALLQEAVKSGVLVVEQGASSASDETTWEPIRGIKITKYTGKFFEIDIPRIIKKITNRKSEELKGSE